MQLLDLAHTSPNINTNIVMNLNCTPQKRDRSPSAEGEGHLDKRPNTNYVPPDFMKMPVASDPNLIYHLKSMTVAQLKSLAKERNIYLNSTLRKPEIIENILDAYYATDNRFPAGTAVGASKKVPQDVQMVDVTSTTVVQEVAAVQVAPEAVVQQVPAVRAVHEAVVQKAPAKIITAEEVARLYPYLNIRKQAELLRKQPPKVITPIEDLVKAARSSLREHIGVKEDGSEIVPRKPVLFFVDLVPKDPGAKVFCWCPGCTEGVAGGEYSIVVLPGIWADDTANQASK